MNFVCLLFSIFLLFSGSFALGQEKITLGVTEKTLESSLGKYSAALYKEVFKNLGYELVIESYPPVRLAKRVKNEKLDGELIRMSSYGNKNPHLVKVSEPHFHFSIAAYSAHNDLKLSHFEELSKYSVSYRKELKVVEKELVGRVPKDLLHPTLDLERSFKLVEAKRVDIFLGVEKFIDEYLTKAGALHLNKVKKVKVLKKDTAHVFLIKKHSHLIESINKELVKLKKSKNLKNSK